MGTLEEQKIRVRMEHGVLIPEEIKIMFIENYLDEHVRMHGGKKDNMPVYSIKYR